MIKKVGLLILISSFFAQAQKVKELDNVQLKEKQVSFELRTHRDIWAYMGKLQEAYPSKIAFVPMFQGNPVAFYGFSDSLWHLARENKWSIEKVNPLKSYRFDFWLQPDFRAIFGNFNQAVEQKTGILLNTSVVLTKGLAFYTGLHFPLVNDLDDQPLHLRLAPTYLSYFRGVEQKHYFQASAGFFFQDRYGLRLDYAFMPLDKPLSFGLKLSQSGYYYFFPERTIRYTPMNELSALAHVAYRFQKQNLTLKLEAGQFLHQDRGARIDFIRQFAKAEIGFFAAATGNGATIGVDLAFRIPPGKIMQGKLARLRTGHEYPFTYIYSRGFKIAENFRLHHDLTRMLRQHHVSFQD